MCGSASQLSLSQTGIVHNGVREALLLSERDKSALSYRYKATDRGESTWTPNHTNLLVWLKRGPESDIATHCRQTGLQQHAPNKTSYTSCDSGYSKRSCTINEKLDPSDRRCRIMQATRSANTNAQKYVLQSFKVVSDGQITCAMVQAVQQATNSLWNRLPQLPQADHPIMIALTTAVAVGIYIVSEPLQRPWVLPCPILSQLLSP